MLIATLEGSLLQQQQQQTQQNGNVSASPDMVPPADIFTFNEQSDFTWDFIAGDEDASPQGPSLTTTSSDSAVPSLETALLDTSTSPLQYFNTTSDGTLPNIFATGTTSLQTLDGTTIPNLMQADLYVCLFRCDVYL